MPAKKSHVRDIRQVGRKIITMPEEDKGENTDVKEQEENAASTESDSSSDTSQEEDSVEKAKQLKEENQRLKEQLRNQSKKRSLKSEEESEDESDEESDEEEDDEDDEARLKEIVRQELEEKTKAEKQAEAKNLLNDFLATDAGSKYSNDGSKEHDENFNKFNAAYVAAEKIHGSDDKEKLFKIADSMVVGDTGYVDDGTIHEASAPGGSAKKGESPSSLTAREAELAKKFGNDPSKVKKAEFGDDFLVNEPTKLTK